MSKNYTLKYAIPKLSLVLLLFLSFTGYGQSFPYPYCGPVSYEYNIEPITLVQFAGIDNQTSSTIDGSPSHENFTNIEGSVLAGQTLPITLNGNTGGSWTNYFTVYIDWNQNNIFDTNPELNEIYNIGSITNSTGASNHLNQSIYVPITALQGQTRMRVSKLYDGYPSSACVDGEFGQTEDYTLNVAIPACTPHTITYTTISNCMDSPGYIVNAHVTDMGSATSINISDNHGTSHTVTATGSIVFGPYDLNTQTTITSVDNTDSDCLTVSGTRTLAVCNDICSTATDLSTLISPYTSTTTGASNDNLTHCTTTNTAPDTYFYITVPDGATLTIGQTSNGYDSTNVIFYGDCDNRIAIDCYDEPDTKTIVWANSTGEAQDVYWIQDGWSSGSGTFTLAWSIVECVRPTATYTVNSLCDDDTTGFEIATNITNMGTASSLTISDGQGNTEVVTNTGIITMGPYNNNTPVVITVTNDDEAECFIQSSSLTQTICNINCNNAIDLSQLTSPVSGTTVGYNSDNIPSCNTSNTAGDIFYYITVPSGATINIGQTVNSYDSAVTAFYGDCTSRTQIDCFDDPDYKTIIWVNDTGEDQNFYWIQDGYGSNTGTYTLQWTLFECTLPIVTFGINSACDSSNEGFNAIANITSMGSSDELTISDNQGNTLTVTETGIYSFGPFENNTSVIITVTNDDALGCTVVSNSLNQLTCPPVNTTPSGAIQLIIDEGLQCGPNKILGISNASTLHTATEIAPNCLDYYNPSGASGDLWYYFVAPSNDVRFGTSNVTGISTLASQLYTGQLGSLTAVNSCSNSWPQVITTLTPGETYYLRVWDYGNNDFGTFDLCGYYPTCSNPAGTYAVNSICDGTEEGFNIEIIITSLGSATSLSVTDNHSFNQTVSEIGTIILGPYENGTNVTVTLTNDENDTCYISTPSVTQSSCPPTYDDCDSAMLLTTGNNFNQYAVIATNENATRSANDSAPNCDGYNFSTNGKDVWFLAEVSANGNLTIETATQSGSPVTDTGMEIYSGDCSNKTYISCSSDIGNGNNFSRINYTTGNPGEIVLVRVYGYNGTSGQFKISAYDTTLSNEKFELDKTKVFPNPFNDILNLSSQNTINSIEIFNMLGQQVMSKVLNKNSTEIDLSQLSSGTYLLKIASDKQYETVKLIKK